MMEDHDGTIVATGDGVRVYDVLSFRAALRLEITTGMKIRRGFNLVKAAIGRGYVPEGTSNKRAAYAALDTLAVSLGAEPYPVED